MYFQLSNSEDDAKKFSEQPVIKYNPPKKK